MVQSNLPSTGSMSSHETGASTVLRFIAFSRGQCGFMYAALDALELPSSPPRMSMGLPCTMSCCVRAVLFEVRRGGVHGKRRKQHDGRE